jgi:phage-related tail fiber protein
MRSREEIERILSSEIKAAGQRQRDAGSRLREVVSDIPSSIPAPDGSLRIRLAGVEYRAALEDLRRALARFDDFVVKGIVPEDVGGWRIR